MEDRYRWLFLLGGILEEFLVFSWLEMNAERRDLVGHVGHQCLGRRWTTSRYDPTRENRTWDWVGYSRLPSLVEGASKQDTHTNNTHGEKKTKRLGEWADRGSVFLVEDHSCITFDALIVAVIVYCHVVIATIS